MLLIQSSFYDNESRLLSRRTHVGFSLNIAGCRYSFRYFIPATHDAKKGRADVPPACNGDLAQSADSYGRFRDLSGRCCRIFATLAQRSHPFCIYRSGAGVTGLAVILGVYRS